MHMPVLYAENQKLNFSKKKFNIYCDTPIPKRYVYPNVETTITKTINYICSNTPDIFF